MYAINSIAIHSVYDNDKYLSDHQKVGDAFRYSVAGIRLYYVLYQTNYYRLYLA